MAAEATVYEYQEAFAYFDADRDGKITGLEFIKVLRALGHASTQKELDSMLTLIDRVYGGYLNFQGFVKVFSTAVEPHAQPPAAFASSVEEALRDFSDVCRHRTDGQVRITDVQLLMTRLGDRVDDFSFLDLLKTLQPPSAGRQSGSGWAVKGGLSPHKYSTQQVVLLPSPGGRRRDGDTAERSQEVAIKDIIGKVLLPPV